MPCCSRRRPCSSRRGDARAAAECGPPAQGTFNCTNAAYSDGIFYEYNVNDLRGSFSFNVPGRSAGPTTITAGASQAVGVSIANSGGNGGSPTLTVGGATGGTAHVVNIVQGTNTNNAADRNNGVYFDSRAQHASPTVNVESGVTIGTSMTPMKQNGIYLWLNRFFGPGANVGSLTSAATIFAAKQGIRVERNPTTRPGATTVTNSGAISSGEQGIWLYHATPSDSSHNGDATITNTGAITVSGAFAGIHLDYRSYGGAEIDNEGTITAMGSGIQLTSGPTGAGAVTLANSGDISGERYGIHVSHGGTAGMVSVDNRGVLQSKNHALYAIMRHATNADAFTLTNTGAATSEDGDGIRVVRSGSGGLTVTNGAAVSGGGFGLYASHGGTAGTVSVTHSGGAVEGRTGILAEVTRASTQSATRATNQPLLDVTWTTGDFTHGTGQAASDDGRFAAASAASMIGLDRTAAAQKAVAETVRYGAAAGIEARILDWEAMVTQVAQGDDPGAIADNAAQMAAVPTGATAADNAYVAQFRAALENDELAVASGVLTAIDSTATSVDDISDAEIVAYLRVDNADRRTLLRNILARGLSEKEQAVLAAVATNTGLTAALDDTAAAFSASYKAAVNALLDRRHLDDVRVAVDGGSIVSRGDGIRAYYVTPNDDNGGIDVTIAAGATVTGGVSGIYVVNAGTGLMVARKYASGYEQGQTGDDLVAAQYTPGGMSPTAVALRDQLVTVGGTVTGGTDAAVRLSGGGVVVLEDAKVHAGSSGVAILVKPGPALVYVDGEVKGADGGAAAVHLTGGGDVTVGLNGKVSANGAARAIRGSDDAANEPTRVKVATGGALEHKEDFTERVEGSLAGVAEVLFREYSNGFLPSGSGYSQTLTVLSNGMLDVSDFPWRPVTPPPLTTSTFTCPDSGRCVLATGVGEVSGRTGVYAAVPRANAPGETRADADQPLIDVTWTGTFAHADGSNDDDRFTAANLVAVVAFDQTAAAGQAVAETVRYGGAAGIEAHALSWSDVVAQVAKGDDPGEVADTAAQTAILATSGAASRRAAILAQFKAALGNAEVDAAAVITAIDSTATSVDDLTDAEIATYLGADDAGIRVLLQNILAQGLSDGEKAVLRAVAAGDDTALDAALTAAGFPDDANDDEDYWSKVKALLDRHNDGNIRIAMNGGSIDSRGDGIRAWYATPHANNGAISVTVATGATVEGAQAGVWVANAGDDIDVSVAGGVTGDRQGIYAANAGEDIDVSLAAGANVTGGTDGIYATNAGGNISVAIAAGATVSGAEAGIHVTDAGGDVRVSVAGSVTGTDGISATNPSGGIGVTIAAGATVSGTEAGVHLTDAGAGLMLARKYTPGWRQDQAQNGEDMVPAEYVAVAGGTTTALLNQLVTVSGTVTGGTDAAIHLEGGGGVLVMDGGEVRAGSSGVAILVNDPGPALLHIDGTVQGGAGGAAAVRLTGGGSVTVGLNGRVEANGATAAIDGGGAGAPRVEVVLATDGMIQYQDEATAAVNARVDGSLAYVDSVRIREYQNNVLTGYSMALTVASNGRPDVSGLPMRPPPPCPEGQVRGDDGQCRTPPPTDPVDPGTGGQQPSGPTMTFEGCKRAMDGRCRLYEALPSMLLAVNEAPSWTERVSAARDGNGGWARVEAARGKWQAKKATTAGKVAYDHRRSVARAGVDFAAGENGRWGVSAHALEGKAEMTGVGEVELSGMGLGASVGWLVEGLYVDVQAAATLYDVDVESNGHGKLLRKDVGGAGYALGVDVGQRMSVGGMSVTPRAGVAWSKVELDDFMDMETAGGPRALVSVEDASGVKGRLGAMVETELEMGAASGRLFGSLDVEREFSDETEVKVGGEILKTEVRPTAVRLGAGGVFQVDENVRLKAVADYRASGSGTSGYGGGLELQVRF